LNQAGILRFAAFIAADLKDIDNSILPRRRSITTGRPKVDSEEETPF